MARYIPNFDINDIRRQVYQAKTGSPAVYEKLDNEWKKLANVVNTRMKALEKADLDFYDYDRMYSFIKNTFGSRRVRLPNKVSTESMEWDDIVNNFQQMLTFVNSPITTVAGAQRHMEDKLHNFEATTGLIIPPSKMREFARLVADDRISQLLDDVKQYASDEVIEALIYASEHDISSYRAQLNRKLDAYIEGTETYDDVLDAIMPEKFRTRHHHAR